MNIRKVVLHTAKLEEMKEFYSERFGFSLVEEGASSFCVRVGSSKLEFTSENVEGNPYYHFAFNIPSNKFTEARVWVKEKVRLNVEDGEDEVYFSHMDAYACYFYDPAGNIVEFIARSTSDKTKEAFSVESILNISEMSLTVKDAEKAGIELINIGIEERDNEPISSNSLNFMGEKSAGVFLLLVQPGRKWIFSDKASMIFPQDIILDKGQISINRENKLIIHP